jgi:glycosyltransferase involved in cell wall biosynthesis
LARVRASVGAFAPDIIHSNGFKAHLVAAMVRGPARLVWYIHDYISERPLMKRALAAAGWRASLALANSRSVAEDARRALPLTKVDVLYNAINLERFTPGRRNGEWLDELARVEAKPALRVGLVATYARWKGHDVFIAAAARVRAARPKVPIRFYLVGGPLYQTESSQYSSDELHSMMRTAGLSDGSLVLVPFQRDTPRVYRSLDIVVHASTRQEPFGRTIIEAMACGRPVIVATAGGATELFTDGVDAIGVPPGDPDRLADAILRLVDDSDLRDRLAAVAHVSAGRFSRDGLGQRLLEHYRGLLNG